MLPMGVVIYPLKRNVKEGGDKYGIVCGCGHTRIL